MMDDGESQIPALWLPSRANRPVRRFAAAFSHVHQFVLPFSGRILLLPGLGLGLRYLLSTLILCPLLLGSS